MKNKMEDKLAQGTMITWFAGFLAIIFILFLFVAMSLADVTIRRSENVKSEIITGSSINFYKSEQQRGLFVFFEEDFQDKENYYIVKAFHQNIEPKKARDPRNNFYKLLKETLSNNYKNKEAVDDCFNFSIIEEEPELIIVGGRSMGFETIYYLKFPEDMKNESSGKSYSFSFQEGETVLINYIGDKCREIMS